MTLDHYVFTSLSPGEAKDALTELQNLGLRAYGSHAPVIGQDAANAMRSSIGSDELWTELLRDSQCFVCKHGSAIVGMAYLVPSGHPWKFFEAGWSYIRLVGVLPEYEGKGIGRKLTTMCIGQARKLNEKTIALHTSEFMHAARHVYESLGFRILKEIEPQWGKQYWIYTLSLEHHHSFHE